MFVTNIRGRIRTGLPYITRKTLPDSWEATAQIHASAATKVMPADATAALAITAWEVEGDSESPRYR